MSNFKGISEEMSIQELLSILNQNAYYNFVIDPDYKIIDRQNRIHDSLYMIFLKKSPVREVSQAIGEIHYKNIEAFAKQKNIFTDTFQKLAGKFVGMILEDAFMESQSEQRDQIIVNDEFKKHVNLLVSEAAIANSLYNAVKALLEFKNGNGKDDSLLKTLEEEDMNKLLEKIKVLELLFKIHQQAYYKFAITPNLEMEHRKNTTKTSLQMISEISPVKEVSREIGIIHYKNIQAFAYQYELATKPKKYISMDKFQETKLGRTVGKIVGILLEHVMFDFESDKHVQLLVSEAEIAKKFYEAVQALLKFKQGEGKDDPFFKILSEDDMNLFLVKIQDKAVDLNYMPSIKAKEEEYTKGDSEVLDSGLVAFHDRLVLEFGGKYNDKEKKTSGVRQKLEEYYSSLGGETPKQNYTIDDAQRKIANIARKIWKKQNKSYGKDYTITEDEVRVYKNPDITINDNLLFQDMNQGFSFDSHTSFNIKTELNEIGDLLHPKIPEEKNKNPKHGNPYWKPDGAYPVFDLNLIDEEKQRKMAKVQKEFYNIFTNSVHMARRCYYVWRADAAHKYVEGLFADDAGEDKEAKKAEKYQELGLDKFDLDTNFLTRLDQLIDDKVRIGYQDSEYQLNMDNLIREFLPTIEFFRDVDEGHMDYEYFNEEWADHHDSRESDRIMAAVQKLCEIRMKARKSKNRDTDPYDPEKSHIIFAAARNPYLVIPDKPLLTSSTYVV